MRAILNECMAAMSTTNQLVQLDAREADGDVARLNILAVTWNVGNKAPLPDFAPLIPRGGGEHDLIVVAGQEATYKAKKGGATPAAAGDDSTPAADDEDDDDDETARAAVALHERHGAGGRASDRTAMLRSKRRIRTDAPPPAAAPAAAGAGADEPDVADPTTVVLEPEQAAASAAADLPVAVVKQANDAAARAVVERSPFCKLLLAHIEAGAADTWRVISCTVLGEMTLLVVCRDRHFPAVEWVATATEATGGPTRNLPNKGGCVSAFKMHGSTFCFAGSHLAAHLKYADVRDQDVAEIVGQVRLGQPLLDFDAQFSYVFWLGDLNYRLDRKIIDGDGEKAHGERVDETLALINDEMWQELMRADQLKDRQQKGTVFQLFQEGEYNFQPTFKVARAPGYDYTRKRVPSYCDRVLWRTLPRLRDHVQQTELRAVPSLATSDHKPVRATFDLRVRQPVTLKPVPAGQAPILRITKLRGENLMVSDLSGTSDPYVYFLSDPPKLFHSWEGNACAACCGGGASASGVPRTSVVMKNVNPMWSDYQVPDLEMNISSAAQLGRCHLFLAVMDWDNLNADDPMGQAVVSLEPLANRSQFQFSAPVTFQSTRQGRLHGQIEVVWRPAETKLRARPEGVGGCCSLM